MSWPRYQPVAEFPGVLVPLPWPILDWDADDRLVGGVMVDRADPIPPHRPHRPDRSKLRALWMRQDRDYPAPQPKKPRAAQPVGPATWPPVPVPLSKPATPKFGGYRSMEALQSDATVFVYAVGSQYFNDVFDALHAELQVSNPQQAHALSLLRIRFGQMRDLLAQRLDLEQRDASVPPPVPAQEAPDGEHHPD